MTANLTPYRVPSPPTTRAIPLWPMVKHALLVARHRFLRWAVRKLPEKVGWSFYDHRWYRAAVGGHWEQWWIESVCSAMWFSVDVCTGISGKQFPTSRGRGICEDWALTPPCNLPECDTYPTPHHTPCPACEVVGDPNGEPHTLECQFSPCHICKARYGQPCDSGLHG